MKIKTGDNVKVISGRDKGKTGKVLQVLLNDKTGEWYVVVEGVNLRKKHMRSRSRGADKGQIIELSAPIHMSKVMMIDPGTNKATRVGYKIDGNEKKRVSKKSGALLA